MTNLYVKKDGYFSFAIAVFANLVIQIIVGSLMKLVEVGSVWYCLLYACISVGIFAVAILYAKFTSKNFWQATSANVQPKWAHILWGCLATLGLIHLMTPLNELFLDFFEWCGFARPNTNFNLPLVALVLLAGILAPVAEEFLFRGTIGQGLVSSKNPVGGIFLSGALFALFHLNPAQTLHQFVLGSFLTLIAYRSGSVWSSVIVHAFNNLVVILLTYTVEPTGFYQQNALLVGIVGGVLFAGAVVGYLFTTKRHAKQQDEQCEKNGKNAFLYQGATSLFVVAVAVCALLWILNLLGE